MEQFVLGLFQEHLSKFIVGFRREQVNANLLNGKGEIKNIHLNCSILNEEMRKMTFPFAELESVHVSRLSITVESWTNLRKAPIHIDLEEVTATIVEPLHYLPPEKRNGIIQLTNTQLQKLIKEGKIPKSRSNAYNLVDRILDNLTIEVQSINITYQPAGKFKTRRLGPWTPPAIRLQLYGIRFVSVNEYGHEATPEEVWRHNHERGKKLGSFLIYKKLETEYQISIVTTSNNKNKDGGESENDEEVAIPIVSSNAKNDHSNNNNNNRNKVEVQLALDRRIRDGEYLSVQVDLTIPVVEVEILASTVPLLAHLITALFSVLAKDRAFTDPLKSAEHHPTSSDSAPAIVYSASRSMSTEIDFDDEVETEEQVKQDVSLLDLDEVPSSSSSSSDDEEKETIKKEDGDSDDSGIENDDTEVAPSEQTVEKENGPAANKTPPNSEVASFAAEEERPLLVLPNGLIFHEKISCSVSVLHATLRGTYAESVDGHIQIIAKGVVVDAIWPKVTKEKGGYAQASISYFTIVERHGRRIRPLLVAGAQYDNTGPVEQPGVPLQEFGRDETFPLFEDRSVRPDPLGLRHAFPGQAFGYKMTVGYNKRLMKDPPEVEVESDEEVMILNEIGIDQVDVVVDTGPWCRVLRFVMNVDGDVGGFDPRWYSGDWSDLLTTDMLLHPSSPLNLDEHVQLTKLMFLDENQFVSSDLFNATIRMRSVSLRLPAAIEEDVRSCDIIVKTNETMIVVSSGLPRTLLGGIDDDAIAFPNDSGDVLYTLERSEDPADRQRGIVLSKAMSTFRAQLTLRGFSVRLAPVISHFSEEPQNLLSPSEMTMIFCFEAEPPDLKTESRLTSMVIALSILAHRFQVNLDFDMLTAAEATISTHIDRTLGTAQDIRNVLNHIPDGEQSSQRASPVDDRIEVSLKGRKVLVRRQIKQSRETGGLSLAFSLQIAESGLCLWRHSVPRSSPLLSTDPDSGEFAPLLKLLDVSMKRVDLGVEGVLHQKQRHLIFKCRGAELLLLTCNFEKLRRDDLIWHKSFEPPKSLSVEDVRKCCCREAFTEVISLGKLGNEKSAFALRAEEVQDGTRSWAVSSEFAEGDISCQVEKLETLLLLFLEALLMPTWRKEGLELIPASNIFPRNILSLLPNIKGIGFDAHDELVENGANGRSSGERVDRVLRTVVANLIPESVDTIMIRLGLDNIIINAPLEQQEAASASDGMGIGLHYSEFVASYFSSDKSSDLQILKQCVGAGKKWSSVVLDTTEGLRHGLKSRQSFFFTKRTEELLHVTQETLVDEFDFSYNYGGANISVSLSEDLSIGDVHRLEDFFVGLFCFTERCKNISTNIKTIVEELPGFQQRKREGIELSAKPSPIAVACSSALSSIRSVKTWFRKMNQDMVKYDGLTRTSLSDKDKEIGALRLLVFSKEKERLAALALVNSDLSGMLRFGSALRTGQRGLLSSTLWPYWIVLRKSLLLLYSGPGQHGVVDIVTLTNASVYQLSGGQRKRDLKRAFAIAESSGAIHFLIAGTDADYLSWVSAIQRAVDMYSTQKQDDTILQESESDHSENSSQLKRPQCLDSSQHSLGSFGTPSADATSQPQGQGRSFGRNLSKVMQATKAKGQAVIGRTPQKKDDRSVGDPNVLALTPEASVVGNIADAISVTSDVSDNVGNVDDRALEDTQMNRGQNFRNRFAGVGQVTKSRFGTALQAAKQKGKQVADRRRHRQKTNEEVANEGAFLAPGRDAGPYDASATSNATKAGESIPEDEPASVTLGDCMIQQEIPSEEGELVADDRSSNNSLAEDGSIIGDLDDPDIDTLGQRRGVKQRLGAAVSRARQAGSDSKMFRLRRRNARPEALDKTTKALKLRNVSLGSRMETPIHPFGACSELQEIPLKKLEGNWFVKVEVVVDGDTGGIDVVPAHGLPEEVHHMAENHSEGKEKGPVAALEVLTDDKVTAAAELPQEEPQKGDNPKQGSADAYTESQLSADDVPQRSCDKDGKENDLSQQASEVLAELNSDNVAQSSIAEEENGLSQGGTDPCFESQLAQSSTAVDGKLDITFRIQVFQRTAETRVVADIRRKLPEILLLHTELSEAVARVPPNLFDMHQSVERDSSLGMNANLAAALGLTTIDAVRMTGKLLGGLLELTVRPGFDHTSVRKYHADAVADFLNTTLDSSLPMDGLELLTDFFQLDDVSTSNSKVYKDDYIAVKPSKKGSVQELAEAGSFYSLSTLCETELSRAENQTILADGIAKTKSNIEAEMGEKPTLKTPSVLIAEVPANSSTTQFRDAMHAALMRVMEERDEAHARMVTAGALHVHEMEQQRKKTNKLKSQLEMLKAAASDNALFGSDRDKDESLRSYEKRAQQDSDAELLSLCQQLAGEISARTAASLEIIRLKESRQIEQEHEAAEKQALNDEVTRLKQQFAQEHRKAAIARQESGSWRDGFEQVVRIQETNMDPSSGNRQRFHDLRQKSSSHSLDSVEETP